MLSRKALFHLRSGLSAAVRKGRIRYGQHLIWPCTSRYVCWSLYPLCSHSVYCIHIPGRALGANGRREIVQLRFSEWIEARIFSSWLLYYSIAHALQVYYICMYVSTRDNFMWTMRMSMTVKQQAGVASALPWSVCREGLNSAARVVCRRRVPCASLRRPLPGKKKSAHRGLLPL